MDASRKAPDIGGPLAIRALRLNGFVGWRLGLGASRSALGVCQPDAVAIHFQNVDVMGQPVEERACEPL